jgi:hypothetical protein
MAKWAGDRDPIPERLCRFVLGEWPGLDLSEATSRWGAECREWLMDPANEGRPLPHSADPVEVRQEVIRVRQELSRPALDDPADGPWRD